jgi:predicted Zn-dependent peptidase
VNCFIDTDIENNFIDWHFSSDEVGVRGVMELCHLIVTDPTWTEGGFKRAKTTAESNARALQRSMERANTDKILAALFGEDRRMREPSITEVNALTIPGCRSLLEKYLRPDNMEVRSACTRI